MEFLLDTHGLIWFINGDNKLPERSKLLISNIDNSCYVSIASFWEIAIKISLKKLKLNSNFEELRNIINKHDFEILTIDLNHLSEIISMEFHHRDPFDRIIIAQNKVEKIPIVTKDKIFKQYNLTTIWD